MEKSVLIISYTFPPYPGIGGRRWAKFAKYLAKSGYTVHVLCAKNPHKKSSLFSADTQSENIRLYTFNSRFPSILQNFESNSLIEKISYKLWMKLLSVSFKGYFFDKAIFDEQIILSIAEKIITTHGIKNVIATGAPFRINYFALTLKKRFPQINLIQDLRDPWTWGIQYSKLTCRRMKFEEGMLSQVIKQSDIITVPVEPMRNYLAESNHAYSFKVQILPHAFDEDEVVIKQEYSQEGFKCVFFGTMYDDIENYYDVLCKVISKNNGKITLDVYTDIVRYKDIVRDNAADKWVKYKKTIRGKALFETLSQYDYIIFIYPDYVKDYLSTKFYEVIHSKIPIIYIAENGFTSNYVSLNKLGMHFDQHTLSEGLQKLIEDPNQLNYNKNFSVNEFSYEEMTEKLTSFFI